MMKRKLLFAALAVSSIGFIPVVSVPAFADTVYIDVAPPAPRHEVVPAHRRGYVWQPGYWDWRGHRHVWVKGYWVKERHGMYWHPNRWEQRDGRWYLERGRWDRERYAGRGGPGGDRDRDGVPNRFDRDKDGDGVPNRYDAAPNNPRRQ
jgi:YXWGXW repeat-containing protein